MTISEFVSAIQLKPKYILPVVILFGLLIFSPCSFLTIFGVQKLVNEYRAWIGAIFLASSVLLISHGIIAISYFAQNKIRRMQSFKVIRKRLHQLSPREIEILSFYIVNNTYTYGHDIRDGSIVGLEKAKIVYRATTMSGGMTFDYNIDPRVRDYLNEHKELLGIKK